MKMSLMQSALVLLTVCVAAAAQCSAILNESQARVDVPVGSSLTLCHRLKSWTSKRFRICWHFNPSEPSLVHSEQLFCSNMSNRTEQKEISLNYTLANVTQQHSGWYFCRIHVDIPELRTLDSSGTPVLVQPHCAIYVNTHHSSRPPVVRDQLSVAPRCQVARTPSPARDKHSSSKQRSRQ
ncbi:uncharacterized protein LOC109532386 isoform X3 [Hippocampus comes]|uniref:uncharacterized protein LOC109532386 isoform X3 n=1 Tax=Hippocampus comes TaxID=109280 RepID=UPI00094E451E|nr:PREDICTED: uncharacterized protein LOC109532386 isoform X3 [Hippocampus comes]